MFEEFGGCGSSSSCGGGGCSGSVSTPTQSCGGGSISRSGGCGSSDEISSLTSRISRDTTSREDVIKALAAAREVSSGSCSGSVLGLDGSSCNGGTTNIYISEKGTCGSKEVVVTVDSSCGGREDASNEDIARAFSKIRRRRR